LEIVTSLAFGSFRYPSVAFGNYHYRTGLLEGNEKYSPN